MTALLADSHASIAGSQIGDFVKVAMPTQIGNGRDSVARKHGRTLARRLKTPSGPVAVDVKLGRDGRPKVFQIFKRFELDNKDD